MDFTYKLNTNLLITLQSKGFSYITFGDYVRQNKPDKFIVLRHDVEQHYENALRFAKIQNQLGIKGSYFFRILPNCFKPEIVKQIADLGHEIGYHYDDLSKCNGNYEKAIARFQRNLNTLRDIAPVQTICMDGSPLSRFDNKDIWKMFNYRDFGIIGEPYFDMDFNNAFYLTDTGRRWDGWKTSLRDIFPQQNDWIKNGLVFHSTNDIIKAAKENNLPNKIMITFHPQRWNNKTLLWIKELVLQNIKNKGKRILIKVRSSCV